MGEETEYPQAIVGFDDNDKTRQTRGAWRRRWPMPEARR
jgi:hypothetical protein